MGETLPDLCASAFKEWASVCRAVACGVQTILIRKGGIDEPTGFRPEHRHFWLYPTHVHEATAGVRMEVEKGDALGHLAIDTFARVEAAIWIDDAGVLPRLEPFHVWTQETIEGKFRYRRAGFWVMVVRGFVAPRAIPIESRPEYTGCRSWIDLDPALSTLGLAPSLNDCAYADAAGRIRSVIGGRS